MTRERTINYKIPQVQLLSKSEVNRRVSVSKIACVEDSGKKGVLPPLPLPREKVSPFGASFWTLKRNSGARRV